MMKRILYFAILVLVFVACGQTPEKKAEVLIKESLKKTLYKPDTYKPVDTKVDSAFAPFDDPALYNELIELDELDSEYEELELKAKQSKSSMAIWSGPYQSAFGRNEYQEAKKDYDEANAKMEKIALKAKKHLENIIEMLQSERKFIGYKAEHNYRADNNAGNTLIGDELFFIDKNFNEVMYSIEVDEYNKMQDAINHIIEKLVDAEE